jgi:hypothetical protein
METEIRRIAVQSQPGQIVNETLSQKYPTHTQNNNKKPRAGGVDQVIECLPSKWKALSSDSSTAQKKKKKKKHGL